MSLLRHILGLTMLIGITAYAAAAKPTTHIYAIYGNDTLRLDRYAPGAPATGQTVIFAFGGGFVGGARDEVTYRPFFNFLSHNGINVVSIDYRTILGRTPIEPNAQGFVASLVEAVTTAVTDMYTATSYVVSNCEVWGCDPMEIVACGSSAGAITALQAEYGLCNGQVPPGLLPDDFNYQGVISMAGAIMALDTPVWDETPCPMLLFHGDADRRVPYGSLTVGTAGLYGSDAITATLPGAYWMYTAKGQGHEMAGEPLTRQTGVVLDFLHALQQKSPLRLMRVATQWPNQQPYRTDFTLEEYIQANLPRH